MAESSIIESIQRYLQALETAGLSIHFGVLFGSHAAGRGQGWSDIDLLVVSPRFDASFSRHEVNLLWRTAARIDSRIEPVPCGVQQWEHGMTSEIVEIARREGQTIYPSNEPTKARA